MGMSEALGVSSCCLGLPLMWNSTLCCGFGRGPHDKPMSHTLAVYMFRGWCVVLWACPRLPRVPFDILNHLFVVVCGCGPHLSHSLAIFCCMYCVPVGLLGVVSSDCLELPLML